ncbi:hypothetical protein RA307_31240 [Xanthobacteraceae bacterium Astr-EGSB]|uniref:hypothetical protein n=1 Tax=Astrobacterium formosum TaxID=3069710 RepID=UPI0027AE68FA|nr:hypothetical protein [Xanthobacteraceae bacterium Astr-EGSB]
MSEAPAPTLADQVAAVDVLAVVELIRAQGRHGAMSASTLAILAMATRIVDLDAIAGGTAELLALLHSLRGTYEADTFRHNAAVAPVVDALAGALTELGYVQPDIPAPPRGDDT